MGHPRHGRRTMQIWQALILGLVEGVTEFLPVSSTGHLILASSLMGLEGEAVKSYEVAIQAGAILAVVLVYRERLGTMLRGMLGRDRDGLRLAWLLFLAFLPAAVLGLAFGHWIKAHLFGPMPVVVALAGGAGILFIGEGVREARAERNPPPREADLADLTPSHALLIGFAQCIAMWPGTSRSLVTLVAALLLGYRLAAAVEFAFLLGLITLGAATAKETWESGQLMWNTFGALPIILGFLAAAVTAFIAVKWMVGYLNRHGLALFGWYRLGLAGLLLLLFVAGWLEA